MAETTTTHRRALALQDVTVEDGPTDDWTVSGRLVPYAKEVELAPRVWEQFSPGTFQAATRAPGRIKFRGAGVGDGHEAAPVVGHAQVLNDKEDGLWGRFLVAPTTAGKDTMVLLRSGVLDELSVEFQAMKAGMETWQDADGFHVRHTRARLLAVAPVPAGAYGRDAIVTLARSAQRAEQEAREAKRQALVAHLRDLRA